MASHFRLSARRRLGSGLLVLAALAAPGARAQTADAETLRQMRQELDALRAEEVQAKAAEQARIQRMDALAQQLARASGEPVVQTSPPVEQIPVQASRFPRSDEGRKFEVYGQLELCRSGKPHLTFSRP